jgi:hypothetical protein
MLQKGESVKVLVQTLSVTPTNGGLSPSRWHTRIFTRGLRAAESGTARSRPRSGACVRGANGAGPGTAWNRDGGSPKRGRLGCRGCVTQWPHSHGHDGPRCGSPRSIRGCPAGPGARTQGPGPERSARLAGPGSGQRRGEGEDGCDLVGPGDGGAARDVGRGIPGLSGRGSRRLGASRAPPPRPQGRRRRP